MKITGVRTQAYQIEMERPIGDANDPDGGRLMPGSALWLDTDEGISGISFGGGPMVSELVERVLIGQDPRGVRGLWNQMVDYVFKGGHRGQSAAAVSALDIALWDLKARINDEPLWKTLGASSPRVRAYASGIDAPLSDDELHAFYSQMAARGVCGGKLKCGLDLDGDLRRIGIMRDALATSGRTPELCIDVNEYWSPKQAIRYMHVIEQEFDITWIEEPARRWDASGLRKVSDNIRAAVASGENLHSIDDYMPLLSQRAIDVVNIGSGAGGITGALQIGAVAYGFETPVTMMNCAANFLAHVAAVLPNHIMMECLENGRDAVLTHSHPIVDGWIELNDEPGLGFTFDEQKLAAHGVTQAGRFGWGRREGAGMYLVGPEEGR
ncbi:MAG: mandelate racemase/muconate lactonizing enzyme family protein [Gemmatimonadetes bacterium]|jgi:L-alanine-DL-glutamate epimerase-like enolase superfamily enzyme|nr:mandelate racemase/muconate lactonizing enzyme family protein [Gemmatimonadota bacterium]MBT6149143.1 mandelate racemase/muconate lactonizing enzyme family protein [Gemmatimonadota bacterium]MBT7864075.1 mandelate racemase/muconate lactonizing enzyme family protein [Gemmatimonadota bacterium]